MRLPTLNGGFLPGPRFLDSDRLLNHKRERFKVFEVESGSNHDDVIINSSLNIDIKFIKLAKLTNISIYVREI